jgi:AcrR family transcriptional regulator
MGRKDKADIRKPEILEHLYEVLKDEGIEGASLAKIADHMGVYPSMLVHYFKTKEQMLIEFVHYTIKRFEDWYMDGLDKINDPKERITLLIERGFLMKGPGIIDPGIFYALLSLSFRKTKIRKAFLSMYALLKKRLVVELTAGIESGSIMNTDINKLTMIIAVITEGLDYLRLVSTDPEPVEEVAQYLKNLVFNLLEKGI